MFIALIVFCFSFSLQAASRPQQPEAADPAFKIVNKATSLGHYVPEDLVPFYDPRFTCWEVQISRRIIEDLCALINAAKKDGLTMRVVSGYRTYEYQADCFERWVERQLKENPHWTRAKAEKKTNQFSAHAGHSEHQLGTVVDILSDENDYKFFLTDQKLKFVGWVAKNAEKFNFKISYPKDSEEFEYEPWHLRWFPKLPTRSFKHTLLAASYRKIKSRKKTKSRCTRIKSDRVKRRI